MATVRRTLDPKALPAMSDEALARLDAVQEKNIDYSDIPELDDDFFRRAGLASKFRNSKTRVTIRLDSDVLNWLKSMGEEGYQTRANLILRAAMEHHKPL
jgi:uncharacterized protein (DUF4415 family)